MDDSLICMNESQMGASAVKTLFDRLQLEILKSARIDCTPTWANAGARVLSDPFSRLYYIRSGSGEVRMGPRLLRLRPGRLYLIPAYTQASYLCPRAMDLTYIHIVAQLSGLGPLAQFVSWPLEIKAKGRAEVEGRFDVVLDDEASFLARDGALRLLLAPFAEAPESRSWLDPDSARLVPVLQHIEQNLHRRMTLAELASLVHLQPNYFSILFAKRFGRPPTRYVKRRRIEVAAERLAASAVPLKELAYDLGFSDAFHLSRTFKSVMGVAPSVYRANVMRDA